MNRKIDALDLTISILCFRISEDFRDNVHGWRGITAFRYKLTKSFCEIVDQILVYPENWGKKDVLKIDTGGVSEKSLRAHGILLC
ncbi:MAG TPA: hypothetical protein VJJ22_03240 [Candidatus Paceibacterota bacterium]